MATGQTLLDTMELINQELQLQSGEEDVTRGLIALNRAQDYLEAILATDRDVKGSHTGTVVTAASTESTAFPTGLFRIDRLQYIDPATSRPAWTLGRINRTGGHAIGQERPLMFLSDTLSGTPRSYWTNGRSIYWYPLPDAIHTVRWYGWQAASDITAGGTFAFDDVAILPLASFAVRLMKLGVDDPIEDIGILAENTFRPIIKFLGNFNRDGAQSLAYRYQHED